jgi:hypothetical protein
MYSFQVNTTDYNSISSANLLFEHDGYKPLYLFKLNLYIISLIYITNKIIIFNYFINILNLFNYLIYFKNFLNNIQSFVLIRNKKKNQ